MSGHQALRFEIYQELGECYTAVGQLDRASQYLNQARQEGLQDPRPLVGLGVIALKENQPHEARNYFEAALALKPEDDQALYGLGQAAQSIGQLPEARQWFQAAWERNPDNLEALKGILATGEEPESLELAAGALRSHLDRRPADLKMLQSLADIYVRQGKVEDAVDLLERILIFEPDNIEARELLVRVQG
ncbi:MAG: tetratricopeptide repeat protein [Desulfobacca sp.]|nr:tetratricopeptide repeat protein [Desulfobacca sp.]